MAHWAAADGALSIQPFEGSRVTTLWDLNCVLVVGGRALHEKGVWNGSETRRKRGAES